MIEKYLLYGITEFFLSISPGPAVLLVVYQAINHGFRSSIYCTVGVLGANLLYFALSALGLGIALAQSDGLFTVIKYIGAFYLLWTAWETARDSFIRRIETPKDVTVLPKVGAMAAFAKGALVELSSIKNLMIFVSIVPQFIDVEYPAVPQLIGLGIVSVIVEGPILLAYGFFAARFSERGFYTRTNRYFDALSIAVLVIIAIFVLSRSG